MSWLESRLSLFLFVCMSLFCATPKANARMLPPIGRSPLGMSLGFEIMFAVFLKVCFAR